MNVLNSTLYKPMKFICAVLLFAVLGVSVHSQNVNTINSGNYHFKIELPEGWYLQFDGIAYSTVGLFHDHLIIKFVEDTDAKRLRPAKSPTQTPRPAPGIKT